MAHMKLLPSLLLFWLFASGMARAELLPLWELETAGNRVLIMGSVHFLRAADHPLPGGLQAAYESADVLVMEIELDSTDPLAAMTLMTTMGTSETGESLADIIGPQAYKQATVLADEVGIPLAMFGQFEPWLAALSISQVRMLQLGFDPAWGIETQFSGQAAADGKDIIGLETMEEQLSFMDHLDLDTQREFLLQSLQDAASLQEETEVIVQAWRSGNTNKLAELLLEGLEESPELYSAIVGTRNRNWVEPIRKFTQQPDDYLVIVGAMHLVGDISVLNLLDQAGVASRQLSNADTQ